MMTPNVPLAAQMAAAKSAGYFFLIMDGAMMPPMAATVAGLEPLMAPKKAEATTVMSPRPPRRDPTRVEARRTSRREMPPCSMIPPASMKKGMAMKRGAHIGVTFITDQFTHPAAVAFFKILRLLIVLTFCGVITWFLSKIIANQMSSGQTSPSLWIPIWIPYAAVPLGMMLMAWRAVEAFVIDWKQSGKEA